MRKILLIICSALSISGIYAQITLTNETSTPRIGDTYRYYVTDKVENLNLSFGGANQEWDISMIEDAILTEIGFVSVTESTQPSSASNLVCVQTESGITAESFYTATSTSLSFDKLILPTAMLTSYTDAREFLKFPLTYTQEYNETFAGTITNLGMAQTFIVDGTTKIKADGYGSLILPLGTIDNVLRVKTVYDYMYSYDFGGGAIPIFILSDTIYTWYNASTRNYIANYSVSYGSYTDSDMEKISATLQYMYPDDIIMSGVNAILDNLVAIYPNPTRGIINITGENEVSDVKIYNADGILLRYEKLPVINISNYSNGLYFIEIAGKKYKIIKQ